MLDMTGNGYFVNSDGVPLSVLEIRYNLATDAFCDFIKTTETHEKFFADMQTECLYYKQYFAKNLCYLFVEAQNEFANNNKRVAFIPENFDLIKNLNKRVSFMSKSLKYKLFNEKDIPLVGDISMLVSAPE